MSLENHIQALQDAYNKVQMLRHIPQSLFKSPVASSALPAPSLISQIQQIKDISQNLKSDSVQQALRAARESENVNGLKHTVNLRRENRKRRRAPSPESPQPYVALDNRNISLFPHTDEMPLKASELFEYIPRFNKEHSCSVHIWKPTRTWSPPNVVDRPAMLRFFIKDIFTAYITIDHSSENPTLVVESVTVFGPREGKSPYSQSDYFVYQNLSQQLSKMIHSHPQVSLQSVLDLLCAYEKLFIDRCSICERVLSSEGHVPPIVRLWTDGKDGERGKWEPRHVNCRIW
ncbi:hypothetical protein Moror_120 [Moniliophthora roreri MCA 2997]|uniref:Uncharacterized protein n=2 Tax=Moniliophthora roreri TaxID=221103 RepID=V2Y0S8_MONRO|nr:hypothetical protein Moror_120 [Moniliophthora roreri MCA 2997]KAI3622194.1 hypothetical protein WG66_015460 [Moniliophthora roreri]